MKITDLRIRRIATPQYKPFTNARVTGSFLRSRWTFSIVEVFTDEGITGLAVSHSLHALSLEIIDNYLKPRIVGEDPMNFERLWRRMFGGDDEVWRKPVTRGEVVQAMSAVDTVVWDVIGKKLGTTVHQLLGGFRDEVPCYASGGHYISLGDHRAEMEYIGPEMQRYVDMGFTAVKMRVGRNVREDLERARLVREVIGPDARLMMDFNMSGSGVGVSETLKQMRALEEVNPYWFEDPLLMDDINGMKQLAEAVDTAIATGETDQTTWGFRDLITSGAAQILLPDATRMCGGITEWRKIAALADAFHIPVAAHIGDAANIHCVAAVPNGLYVEVFTPHDDGYYGHEIDPARLPNERGNVSVSASPGLGVELDEEYVEVHLVRE